MLMLPRMFSISLWRLVWGGVLMSKPLDKQIIAC